MKLTLPKTPCWNCPEGNHRATCLDARIITESKNGKPTNTLLLVFEINVDDDDNVQYMAKRKYDLPIKCGNPLMNDLTGWFGDECLKKNKELDLSLFKGKKADVSLVHIHNEGHEKPWVHIQSIHAPGSLVTVDGDAAVQSRFHTLKLENIR